MAKSVFFFSFCESHGFVKIFGSKIWVDRSLLAWWVRAKYDGEQKSWSLSDQGCLCSGKTDRMMLWKLDILRGATCRCFLGWRVPIDIQSDVQGSSTMASDFSLTLQVLQLKDKQESKCKRIWSKLRFCFVCMSTLVTCIGILANIF